MYPLKIVFSSALIALFLLSGCGPKPLAETQMHFQQDCWNIKDTLSVSFQATDPQKIYRLSFPIHFTEDYSYNNIYLRARITTPEGEQSLLPTRFSLSDPIGNWYSTPQGDEVPFQLTIADGLQFNQDGIYKVDLFQYMRDKQLCGVRSAGIALLEQLKDK